jgi:hypothetical protein
MCANVPRIDSSKRPAQQGPCLVYNRPERGRGGNRKRAKANQANKCGLCPLSGQRTHDIGQAIFRDRPKNPRGSIPRAVSIGRAPYERAVHHDAGYTSQGAWATLPSPASAHTDRQAVAEINCKQKIRASIHTLSMAPVPENKTQPAHWGSRHYVPQRSMHRSGCRGHEARAALSHSPKKAGDEREIH